jgi:sugar O-acyltransferase (sialic acid O-acetyltransferase NeuD family)
MQDSSTDRASPIAVFGGPGAGALAAFTLRRIADRGGDVRFVGFLNDLAERGTRIAGESVLAPFDGWQGLPPETLFLAPLHKPKEMPARATRIARLGIPSGRWTSVVDPDAAMATGVEHGPGLFVAAHATVMPAARLGAHVAVRGGGYVGHDAVLDDYAFIGANAVVCGYARLGTGVHVAPGALVREGTTIGRYAVIGLGAVVVRDVPDYAVMAGNPARMIGKLQGEAT